MHELYPAIPRQRRRIEGFLQANGLRYDDVDYYAALVDESSDEIVAGGGLKGGVIKCVAVADGHKGEAVANQIVSHLIAKANAVGHQCVKLFTKPQNRPLFESLSFRFLAEAPEAILMETGVGGIAKYSEELRAKSEECNCYLLAGRNSVEVDSTKLSVDTVKWSVGVIVMNCNPFTLGHRYLIERSSELVERLYVVVVREDCSMFSYSERKAMVNQGVKDLGNVVVVDGSDYAVSATTFPTYFLKRISDATDTQILLDLDIYLRHIAPALGANVRFVGSEPTDPLTRRYNELMRQQLGDDHICEIPRMEKYGSVVSASRVRRAIEANSLWQAIELVPSSTIPYIIAHLATRALQAELDTTPKPGLVDKRDNGAHRDMDHALMLRSIRALHPYFIRLAQLGCSSPQPPHDDIVRIGIEAERAMFEATGGVNTYKGALFSMGLAVIAAGGAALCHNTNAMSSSIAALASRFPVIKGTHGSEAKTRACLKGALDNARDGYRMLFEAWLPFYETCVESADPYALHKTLLRIMCDLDDTNIVYRTSLATMLQVKEESKQLLQSFSIMGLETMNSKFMRCNISPGGSADMLSLVVFLYSVLRKQ